MSPNIVFPTDTAGKTPVWSDIIPLADSAAWNALKETTVTDLSTASFWLKTTSDLTEWINKYYTEAKVSANTDVASNTSARHTHSNKATLDATTASYTTAEKTKLSWIATWATSAHWNLTWLLNDDHTQYSLISSQAGAPTTTPSRVWLTNVDTTNWNTYTSKGITSSADWVQTNGAGGWGGSTVKVSANDTTAWYLNWKLVAGANITLTKNNNLGNETYTIATWWTAWEINTASNVWTTWIWLFKQKTGVNLEFKKINTWSTKVTIIDNVVNSEVDIDIAEANLTLSNLWGAVTDAQVPNTITLDNITQITNRSHTALTDIWINTHIQIDTHIANTTTNPHNVTATNVWLWNVDNTSDVTKNSAIATLTNKTINLLNNTVSGTTAQFNSALSDWTFSTLAGTETLTNKTMTGTNNVLTASLLKSATTEVNVSTATAPTTWQVLTATSGTSATWQSPSGWGWGGIETVKIAWTQVVWTSIFEYIADWAKTVGNILIALQVKPVWADFLVKTYKNWTLTNTFTIATTATATNWRFTASANIAVSLVANDVFTAVIDQVWTTTKWSEFSALFNIS